MCDINVIKTAYMFTVKCSTQRRKNAHWQSSYYIQKDTNKIRTFTKEDVTKVTTDQSMNIAKSKQCKIQDGVVFFKPMQKEAAQGMASAR